MSARYSARRTADELRVWSAEGPVDLVQLSGCCFLMERDFIEQIGEVLDGYREADPVVAARHRGNGGVDADNLAVEIYQRAAAIAGIDAGIGLD